MAVFFLTTLPSAEAGRAQAKADAPVKLAKIAPVKQSQSFQFVSTGEVVGIVVAGVAVVALIGFGIYYLSRDGHSIKGCTAAGPDGLLLATDGGKSYMLSGEVGGIKSGEMLRLHGKKNKGDKNYRKFTVEKVSKDYGPCVVKPATP